MTTNIIKNVSIESVITAFSDKKPIFIIVMPGSLHIVDLCLKYLPKYANIVLILNGLCQWEEEWISHNLVYQWSIRTDWILDHPTIINKLFQSMDYPFGIMDYDCFLVDPKGFEQFLTFDDRTLGNAFFYQKIHHLDFYLPHTHALFFNTARVRKLFEDYDIDASRIGYDELTAKNQIELNKLGINSTCLPEADYNFDTLKVMILLGLVNGLEFHRISNKNSPKALHIGCISEPERFSDRWRCRASYFWQLALNNHQDDDLKRFYWDKYPNLPAVAKLKLAMENDTFTKPEFFTKVDRILFGPSV